MYVNKIHRQCTQCFCIRWLCIHHIHDVIQRFFFCHLLHHPLCCSSRSFLHSGGLDRVQWLPCLLVLHGVVYCSKVLHKRLHTRKWTTIGTPHTHVSHSTVPFFISFLHICGQKMCAGFIYMHSGVVLRWCGIRAFPAVHEGAIWLPPRPHLETWGNLSALKQFTKWSSPLLLQNNNCPSSSGVTKNEGAICVIGNVWDPSVSIMCLVKRGSTCVV